MKTFKRCTGLCSSCGSRCDKQTTVDEIIDRKYRSAEEIEEEYKANHPESYV